jgi:hypothetical protein
MQIIDNGLHETERELNDIWLITRWNDYIRVQELKHEWERRAGRQRERKGKSE